MFLKNHFHTLNTFWRWILGVLSILLLLVAGIQLILSLYLDDVVGNHLKKEVRAASQDRYQLQYGELDLSLITRSIKLEHLSLAPDSAKYAGTDNPSKAYPVRGNIDMQALRVSGISIWNYLIRDELVIGSILLDQPRLSAEQLRKTKSSSQAFSSVDSSLFALISGKFRSFRLDEFIIKDGSFLLADRTDSQKSASVKKLNLQLQDILVDSTSAQSGQMFVTDNIELDVEVFTLNLMRDLYTVRVPGFKLSSTRRQISADSVQLIPNLPRYEFSKTYGRQTDHIDLLISDLSLGDMDFTLAADSGRFQAKLFELDRARLDVFRNKNIPSGAKSIIPLPQLAFRELPVPIKIQTLKIRDTDISYTEHQKDVPKPGKISFNDLQATIKDISNLPGDLQNGHQTTMDVQTRVMNKGLLNAYFTFHMDNPEGRHFIQGHLDTMAFSQFNPALENLAFIRIDQGVINSLEFAMNLNSEIARGTVTMDYENLKLEMLKSETLEQGTGQEIKSFIANTFVVQENNKGSPLRKGEINFERDKNKSVFNYWWKALSTGLKNSIGL